LTRPRSPTPRRFDPVLWLAVLTLLASLGQTVMVIRRTAAIDFYHFWLVGEAVRTEGASDVYGAQARERLGALFLERAAQPGVGEAQRQAATKFARLETTGTPLLYASFAPFLTGDYDEDRQAYNFAALLLFVVLAAALAVRLGYGARATVLMLVFVLAAYEPVASDVRVGNVNRIQFVLVAAYVLLQWGVGRSERGRHVLGGVLLGLAGMFKPNLAFVVAALFAFWVGRGEKTRVLGHVVGLALGALGAFAASSAFFGTPSVWLWWAEAAASLTSDFPIRVEDGNFAPARLLEGVGLALGPLWSVLWIVAGGALLWLAGRRAAGSGTPLRGAEVLLAASLGGAISLLAAPLAWLHYYVLALFLVLWVLRPDAPGVAPRSPGYRAAAVASTALVSMGPILGLVLSGEPYGWGTAGNLGLVGLVALGGVDLFGLAREAAAAGLEAMDPVSDAEGPSLY